ncbi:TniQ family protein [Paraburkholderia sp. J76]|uniref:TniQ family protein n=1 Tax=Paraburkholderia sp. J76 TaxID=2805439 RepID=UPI002ABD677C|nr:TniQ family protein [Paraburkholderia sp. J76]
MKTRSYPSSASEESTQEGHTIQGGSSETALYSLEPEAIGTAQCESAVSYLCRLAYAHHVPVDLLVNQVLARFFGDDFSIWRHFSTWKKSAAINIFTHQRTPQLLSALRAATGRVELDQLSLSTLGDVLDLRGSSSEIPHHCPLCHSKDVDVQRTYRPLLWDLKLVRVCPDHKVALVPSVCGAPQSRRLSLWGRPHVPGACSTCGSIGYGCTVAPDVPVNEPDVWVAQELGLVVAHVTAGERFMANDVVKSVLQLASLIGDGRPYRAAPVCGISKARLFDWINGRKLVRLSPLVALCAAAGVGLLEALRGEIVQSERRVDYKYSPVRGGAHAASPSKRSEAMRRAARDVTCPSLTRVADSLGLSTKYLSQCFPVESREVVRRYRDAKRIQTERRQLEADELIARLATELQTEGLRLTKRNVWLRARVMVTSQSRFERAWIEFHGAGIAGGAIEQHEEEQSR